MEQQEWVNYFRILYGRNPSPQEFKAAKDANFPPFTSQTQSPNQQPQHNPSMQAQQPQQQATVPPGMQFQQATPAQQETKASNKFKVKFNLELIIKVIVFIFVGLLGYIIGYHLN